jgi:phenylacetate-coenzyme A ligase PaaK-like adenylate-forming protein
VRLREGDVCLYTLAPAPYFTGAGVATGFLEELNPKFIPSLDEGSTMGFEERIAAGFRLALKDGIDLFYGLSSVLVAVAQQFEKGSGKFEPSVEMLHPGLLYRVAKALLKSKLGGRGMLPKDLWKVKGIVAGGMDTSFFRDTIESYWGRKPLEGYGGTELGGIALQTWTYKGMTFLPDCNYLEFIPEDDFYQNRDDPSFQPRTFNLAEVKPGVYELVITNFHGNLFTRYRTGDLVNIVALRDDETDIDIPQMIFHARADGVIDISGFTRLTEKTIWQAINDAGVANAGWTVSKEYEGNKPIMHIYIEATNGFNPDEAGRLIHEKLKNIDSDYSDLEKMLGINPLRVSRLAPGAFERYMDAKRKAGAEMAHLKPPRVNPKDSVLELLTSLG